MASRISPKISVIVYGCMVVIFYLTAFLVRDEIAPILVMDALVGFFCSMGMVFTIFVFGHIYQIMGIRRKPNLMATAISSILSCIIAYIVSPLCFPFTVCINIPMQIYLYYASNMKTPDSFNL